MEPLVEELRRRLSEPELLNASAAVRRIAVKDALIPYFLKFIYDHRFYRRLMFYGGSCARLIYGLNRMSEDIDLDNSARVPLNNFAADLTRYLHGRLNLKNGEVFPQAGPIIRRWTVRLPLLFNLGLSANPAEKLHVKLEISPQKQTAIVVKTPLVKAGQSMVVSHFSRETLMAGKMIACLERIWKRGTGNKITVKGRDYYDLIWYLQQRIRPLEKKLIKDAKISRNTAETLAALAEKMNQIKPAELTADLLPLFPDQTFVRDWVKNFPDFFARFAAEYK